MDKKYQVDPLADYPDTFWHKNKTKFTCKRVKPINANTPLQSNALRVVVVSDTHGQTLDINMPQGDLLIHAGDFGYGGELHEILEFNGWLLKLDFPRCIVIAGNHEITFDESIRDGHSSWSTIQKYLDEKGLHHVEDLLTACTYLRGSGTVVHGINIWGAPWQPTFGKWGFNLERGEALLNCWSHIPIDTDIVVTHTPPVGYGDYCASGERVGCVDLLNAIQRVKPRYHVFGHIHESYGMYTDGVTTYVNASTCNLNYKPVNTPIVFDVPLPPSQAFINRNDVAQ